MPCEIFSSPQEPHGNNIFFIHLLRPYILSSYYPYYKPQIMPMICIHPQSEVFLLSVTQHRSVLLYVASIQFQSIYHNISTLWLTIHALNRSPMLYEADPVDMKYQRDNAVSNFLPAAPTAPGVAIRYVYGYTLTPCVERR